MVDTQHPSREPSPALLMAQARLEQFKLAQRAERDALGLPGSPRPGPEPAVFDGPSLSELGQALLVKRRRQEAQAQGERASDALKATLPQNDVSSAREFREAGPSFSVDARRSPSPTPTVKVYPSLAIAMLDAGLAAPGRVYWLLRFLDTPGRGWLTVDEVRAALATKKSELRICGWRRLRQTLAQGEGIFWQRDDVGRLWLYGIVKTAQSLSVGRLVGYPVELPVSKLLGPIKAARAHLYATFHSGRRENNPISRETLKELTGVPERTQLEYDKAAGVKRRRNLAIGERYNKANVEKRAWRQGRATFHFLDVQGQQGKAGREYIAWHLPNTYQGPHSQGTKGRQKKINQELADLVMKGMRGNDRERVERIFWPHPAAAGGAYNRDQERDAYWPGGKTEGKRYNLWNVLTGTGD